MRYVRIGIVLLAMLFVVGAQSLWAGPPNILFVMSDDHAYQAISAYDGSLNQTPNIDRLASEGMRFDRCYVTNSICGPSRACLLTGKYGHKNGVEDNYTEFDGSQQTFPKLLQQAGYQTAMIGKWHLKSVPTGFDYFDVLPGQGKYYRPKFKNADGERDVEGYVTNITTDLATKWLTEQRDKEKPFLLLVHHKAPHRPWDPGPEHLRAFEGVEFAEPETLYDEYTGKSIAIREAEMRIEQMRPSPDLKIWAKDDRHRTWLYDHMTDEVRKQWEEVYDPRFDKYGNDQTTGHERRKWMFQLYLRDYLGCINSIDEGVGQILECLEQEGLADNTIVVYTSDQGFYLGEHGFFDKRLMYEQSLRTPLLVRWPAGIEAGQVEQRIVSNLDFAETFLDAAGADIPADMQGDSFLPILRGESPDDWRTSFYYRYQEGKERDHRVAKHDGVTNGRHKLIHYFETDEWELFDLEQDPNEVNNVYGQEPYLQVQTQLKVELQQLRNDYDVPRPVVGGNP